jgi:ParB-like chromosome segregation protein Spo0J
LGVAQDMAAIESSTTAERVLRDLVIERWPLERLVPYARNARTHTDEQVAQVSASILEFGWTNPILVGGDHVIIAGHARLLAARKLGMTEVPVIVLDHLTPTQRRALVLALEEEARLMFEEWAQTQRAKRTREASHA